MFATVVFEILNLLRELAAPTADGLDGVALTLQPLFESQLWGWPVPGSPLAGPVEPDEDNRRGFDCHAHALTHMST